MTTRETIRSKWRSADKYRIKLEPPKQDFSNLKFINLAEKESDVQVYEEDAHNKLCSCRPNQNGTDFTGWLGVYLDKDTHRPYHDDKSFKKETA